MQKFSRQNHPGFAGKLMEHLQTGLNLHETF
jgi:hypothetical protein